MREIILLITTESDEKKAIDIAKLLIERNLAACVSLKNIISFYKWENEIEETREVEIIIKSKPGLKDDLIVFLKEKSSYDVPQIIFKKFESEKKYYEWVTESFWLKFKSLFLFNYQF